MSQVRAGIHQSCGVNPTLHHVVNHIVRPVVAYLMLPASQASPSARLLVVRSGSAAMVGCRQVPRREMEVQRSALSR
jgi:hypothetical protein